MLSSFPAAFLWPSSQTAILAAISCLFDASSVVFAIMAQLFFADPHLFQRRNVFSLYAVRRHVDVSLEVVCLFAVASGVALSLGMCAFFAVLFRLLRTAWTGRCWRLHCT